MNGMYMADTILLIDDDPAFGEELAAFLEDHGFTCECVVRPDKVLAMMAELQPILLLIDQRLGAISGTDVLRAVRGVSDVPCVILTGINDPVDRILGLELGADDYIHKTAMPREILARIRAVLRRTRTFATAAAPAAREQAAWDLRVAEHELYRPDGSPCRLTFAEFTLLRALVEARGEPLSRDILTEAVFDRPYRPGDRAIDSLIVRLRRRLEPDPEQPIVIKSARQQGYLFTGFAPAPSPEPTILPPPVPHKTEHISTT